MGEDEPWTAGRLSSALQAQKRLLEAERRAFFEPLGVSPDCCWPASRVFQQHSVLGPAWAPILTEAEVETLTLNLDYKRYPDARRISLPRPGALGASLETVIRTRQSERAFSARPVSIEELAKLLLLGGGVTKDQAVPRRAAPSPGGLYPIEMYPLAFSVQGLAPAVYHYATLDHELELIRPVADIGASKEFLPSDFLSARPALVIALTAVFPRVQMKYLERGYRFALLETGHIAQNLLLAATALDLAAAPVGGFWDDPFNDLLGLEPATEAVLYAIVVGHKE
jgi:SagB-type dehydrogenase family enzyme